MGIALTSSGFRNVGIPEISILSRDVKKHSHRIIIDGRNVPSIRTEEEPEGIASDFV